MTQHAPLPDPLPEGMDEGWEAYRHIEAWGIAIASFWHYIEGEMRRAAADKAPLDALYYSTREGRWVTADDLPADHELHRIYQDLIAGKRHALHKPVVVKSSH